MENEDSLPVVKLSSNPLTEASHVVIKSKKKTIANQKFIMAAA